MANDRAAAAGPQTNRWTNEFLDSMRKETDPETDAIARSFFEGFPSEKDGVAALVDLKKRYLDDWDAPMPSDLAPGIRAFFDKPIDYPAWVDPRRIDVASDLFMAYGPISLMTLLLKSAPLFWTNPAGAHAFYVAQIFSPESVARRMKLLPMFVLNFTLRGQLEQRLTGWPPHNNAHGLPPGISVYKSRGIITIQKLRMAHAVHRIILTREQPKPELNWDRRRFGEPINQEDLAQAMLHFCFSTIEGLASLGIEQDEDEQEATLMAWKTVAFLLGLREELQPRDLADGRLLLQTSYNRHDKPTHEGAALIEQALGVLRRFLPWPYKSVPAAMMRYLLGDAVADSLKVPDPKLILWLFRSTRWLWKDHKLFLGISEWFSPKLIRWLDDDRKLVTQLRL
jgi:ER-bound oxygenase mpaB/B'/Rubber oxygenase, catalytic domain